MLQKIRISSNNQKLIIYFVLAVAILAVYWQVNHFTFINVDDDVCVTDNYHVQSEMTPGNFLWAFTTLYQGYWHPLTWLSFMIDYQLYGADAGGYHVTNVILHVLSTLLLFWVFNRMTGAVWRSAFVAAFFGLHPLRVESVVWISERKDVLSIFFAMLTVCSYIYYTEKPVMTRYLMVLFFFLCGLMSKPIVVTLPVLMILLDYWPLQRFKLQKGSVFLWQLKEKTLFFVLAASFSLTTFYGWYNPSLKYFSLQYRLTNALDYFVTYLAKIFWPHNMAIFYSFTEHIAGRQSLFALLIIVIITTVVIPNVKSKPHLLVGWLWYVVAILPALGITQTGVRWMHDTYTYFPSVGIAMIIAWGIPSLFQSEEKRKNILYPAAIIIVGVISLLTWQQIGYWKNNFELWNHAVLVTKNNYVAYNNRGVAFGERGNYQQAFDDFNEAIRLKPDDAVAYNNKGSFYGDLRQYQTAIEYFNKAIALKSDDPKAYCNRGIAYFHMGRYQQAIDDFNEAIRIRNDYADALHNIAVVYLKSGNISKACEEARKNCAKGVCKTMETLKSQGYCHW